MGGARLAAGATGDAKLVALGAAGATGDAKLVALGAAGATGDAKLVALGAAGIEGGKMTRGIAAGRVGAVPGAALASMKPIMPVPGFLGAEADPEDEAMLGAEDEGILVLEGEGALGAAAPEDDAVKSTHMLQRPPHPLKRPLPCLIPLHTLNRLHFPQRVFHPQVGQQSLTPWFLHGLFFSTETGGGASIDDRPYAASRALTVIAMCRRRLRCSGVRLSIAAFGGGGGGVYILWVIKRED
jgi:hypothetical protein